MKLCSFSFLKIRGSSPPTNSPPAREYFSIFPSDNTLGVALVVSGVSAPHPRFLTPDLKSQKKPLLNNTLHI